MTPWIEPGTGPGVRCGIRRAGLAGLIAGVLSASPAAAAEVHAWTMFQQADPVVRLVMFVLAAAAMAGWIVLIAKKIEIWREAAEVRGAVRALTVDPGPISAITARAGGTRNRVAGAMLDTAADELTRAGPTPDPDGARDRIGLRLARIEAAAIREIGFGAGLLGTIGATAPFVGLFGTVWGIMHSFVGIADAKTTNLAVVAPGIAEALLATAIGLVAAIPAVVFHNHLARAIAGYRALVVDLSTMVLVLASRDLSSRDLTRGDPNRAEPTKLGRDAG